jgi:aminopeptidase YwaD
MDHPYLNRTNSYLRRLCVDIPTRLVGTPGNQAATGFIDETMRELGWQTERQRFDSLAYRSGAISLSAGDTHFNAAISPYSLGCDVQAELACATNLEELRSGNFHGKILLLQDELTREQLAPINYVFFKPRYPQGDQSPAGRTAACGCSDRHRQEPRIGRSAIPLPDDRGR